MEMDNNLSESAYKQVVSKESPVKEWLIDYVGEQHNPKNDEITVEMIVETMVILFLLWRKKIFFVAMNRLLLIWIP